MQTLFGVLAYFSEVDDPGTRHNGSITFGDIDFAHFCFLWAWYGCHGGGGQRVTLQTKIISRKQISDLLEFQFCMSL